VIESVPIIFLKCLTPLTTPDAGVHIKVEYFRGPFCLPTPHPPTPVHSNFIRNLLCTSPFCIKFIEKYNEKLVVLVPNREQHGLEPDNAESLDSYLTTITGYCCYFQYL
jgi:hypothetical protein